MATEKFTSTKEKRRLGRKPAAASLAALAVLGIGLETSGCTTKSPAECFSGTEAKYTSECDYPDGVKDVNGVNLDNVVVPLNGIGTINSGVKTIIARDAEGNVKKVIDPIVGPDKKINTSKDHTVEVVYGSAEYDSALLIKKWSDLKNLKPETVADATDGYLRYALTSDKAESTVFGHTIKDYVKLKGFDPNLYLNMPEQPTAVQYAELDALYDITTALTPDEQIRASLGRMLGNGMGIGDAKGTSKRSYNPATTHLSEETSGETYKTVLGQPTNIKTLKWRMFGDGSGDFVVYISSIKGSDGKVIPHFGTDPNPDEEFKYVSEDS